MSMANLEAETLTMKQRIFIGVLGVLSVLLAALVVFYFSPAEETSEALPGRTLSLALQVRTVAGVGASKCRSVNQVAQHGEV
jgi:hypothetical protein